jgi:hypothetical protein
MKANELIPRLINEFGYPPQGAQIIADKLANSTSQIQTIFNKFWEDGNVPDIEVEGYTISDLTEEHGMKPIAAFLTLDWLIREPEKAKASLQKGHDYVEKREE